MSLQILFFKMISFYSLKNKLKVCNSQNADEDNKKISKTRQISTENLSNLSNGIISPLMCFSNVN